MQIFANWFIVTFFEYVVFHVLNLLHSKKGEDMKTKSLSYVNESNKTVRGAAAFEHVIKESGFSYQEVLELIEDKKLDSICVIPLDET